MTYLPHHVPSEARGFDERFLRDEGIGPFQEAEALVGRRRRRRGRRGGGGEMEGGEAWAEGWAEGGEGDGSVRKEEKEGEEEMWGEEEAGHILPCLGGS